MDTDKVDAAKFGGAREGENIPTHQKASLIRNSAPCEIKLEIANCSWPLLSGDAFCTRNSLATYLRGEHK